MLNTLYNLTVISTNFCNGHQLILTVTDISKCIQIILTAVNFFLTDIKFQQSQQFFWDKNIYRMSKKISHE